MANNVGTFDRIARVLIGIALIAFALGYLAPGTGWNWVGWIGVVPILTALFGTCPPTVYSGCRRDNILLPVLYAPNSCGLAAHRRQD